MLQDSDEWRGTLLERCHPTFVSQQQHFPNHTGTPPALHIVASLYSYQASNLNAEEVLHSTLTNLYFTASLHKILYSCS